MPNFGELINKAKQLAGQHPDQVSKGIEKIEELADKQTGGKYHDQVEGVGHAAENYLGAPNPDNPGGQPQGNQQGGQPGNQQNPNQPGN